MKLIIDISEEDYKWVCDHVNMGHDLFKMIANGTPLTESDDCVSRQAVLDLVVANHTELNGLNVVMYSPFYKDITQLPPVNPQNDLLGKIRAEIEQNAYPIVHGVNNHELGMTSYGILQVIDKYRKGNKK